MEVVRMTMSALGEGEGGDGGEEGVEACLHSLEDLSLGLAEAKDASFGIVVRHGGYGGNSAQVNREVGIVLDRDMLLLLDVREDVNGREISLTI